MTDVPEIEVGAFLEIEHREKSVALRFQHVTIVLKATVAVAVGYLLTERK